MTASGGLGLPGMCVKGIASRHGDGKRRPFDMLRAIPPFLRGEWPKWFLVGVWSPVVSVLSIAFLAASARHYPGGYDWRYEVMCRLGYEAVNPAGSVYWAWALGLICLGGLPCCAHFRRSLMPSAPALVRWSSAALAIGLCAGIVVSLDGAVLPRLNTIFHKLHETTATLTFAAIFIGVMGIWIAMIKWLRVVRHWTVGACSLVSLLVAAPFAGAMISQAYLFFVPNDLGWVGADWAAKNVPLYLSFAFWEWLAIAGIYVSLYVMALLLPSAPPAAGGD